MRSYILKRVFCGYERRVHLKLLTKRHAQLQVRLLSNSVESLPSKGTSSVVEGETPSGVSALHASPNDADGRTVTTSSKSASSRTCSDEDDEDEACERRSPSTMEAAADAAGSRNVGESRLASALSALGLPDAGATGVASLMAAGFVAAGGKKKKEAALKLGLASKLSKSIADLGGRGAASAAGIASLCELLKDSRDMSTTRLADQIGQALQRIGGAGAAVGYAALAASLKAIGDKPKPGALIGGIVLALAEQGAAPGTAGLAALAAGLGGSGADALAGGLGGSLPNIIAAVKTNNFMSGGGGGDGGGGSFGGMHGGGAEDANAALVGGGHTTLQAENTDAEYTGQGPIGSSSQGGGGGGGGGVVIGGGCRSLGTCQPSSSSRDGIKNLSNDNVGGSHSDRESPYASVVRSPAKEKVLYGGGELVNTAADNRMEQKCNVKRSTSPRCKFFLSSIFFLS